MRKDVGHTCVGICKTLITTLIDLTRCQRIALHATHCSADVGWLQESTSFGGHSIPTGGHRRVSGLVRACVKEEVRKQIEIELNDR